MRRLLVLAAATAVLCVLAPVASSTPSQQAVQPRAGLERAVARELNRVRVGHGLRPFRIGDGLRTAAAQHSRSMLELGYFEHESADGTSFDDRIRRFYTDQGWQNWAVGETLLSSSVEITAREIVATWIGSKPHRDVLFSRLYRDAGVGVFYAPAASGAFGGEPALVVTADFGLRHK